MSNQRICFICRTYVYWGIPIGGTLEHANCDSIMLSDCYIIYDTGPWSDPEWKIAEYLGNWSVRKDALESWGITNKRLPAGGISAAEAESLRTTDPTADRSDGSQQADGVDNMRIYIDRLLRNVPGWMG